MLVLLSQHRQVLCPHLYIHKSLRSRCLRPSIRIKNDQNGLAFLLLILAYAARVLIKVLISTNADHQRHVALLRLLPLTNGPVVLMAAYRHVYIVTELRGLDRAVNWIVDGVTRKIVRGINSEFLTVRELYNKSRLPIEHGDPCRPKTFVHLLMEGNTFAHMLVVTMKPDEPIEPAVKQEPFHKAVRRLNGGFLIGILLDQPSAPIIGNIANIYRVNPRIFLTDTGMGS